MRPRLLGWIVLLAPAACLRLTGLGMPCVTDADCRDGFVCAASPRACRPATPVVADGGSAADAGRAEDAGEAPADDAGVTDAGSFDAGLFDAGHVDAGVAEAGSPDAGFFDAGLAPPAWTCPSYAWNDEECSCGCSIPDPRCASSDLAACNENRCPSVDGVAGSPDRDDPTQCVPPTCGNLWRDQGEQCDDGVVDGGACDSQCIGDLLGWGCGRFGAGCAELPAEWWCAPREFGDDYCDCGCGAVDIDCIGYLLPDQCVNRCDGGTPIPDDTGHCE